MCALNASSITLHATSITPITPPYPTCSHAKGSYLQRHTHSASLHPRPAVLLIPRPRANHPLPPPPAVGARVITDRNSTSISPIRAGALTVPGACVWGAGRSGRRRRSGCAVDKRVAHPRDCRARRRRCWDGCRNPAWLELGSWGSRSPKQPATQE